MSGSLAAAKSASKSAPRNGRSSSSSPVSVGCRWNAPSVMSSEGGSRCPQREANSWRRSREDLTSSLEKSIHLLQLGEEFPPARPGFVPRLPVPFPLLRIVRLAGAHETVTGAFVDHRVIFFAGGFHQLLGFRNRDRKSVV